jgi:hypothetical protein
MRINLLPSAEARKRHTLQFVQRLAATHGFPG